MLATSLLQSISRRIPQLPGALMLYIPPPAGPCGAISFWRLWRQWQWLRAFTWSCLFAAFRIRCTEFQTKVAHWQIARHNDCVFDSCGILSPKQRGIKMLQRPNSLCPGLSGLQHQMLPRNTSADNSLLIRLRIEELQPWHLPRCH